MSRFKQFCILLSNILFFPVCILLIYAVLTVFDTSRYPTDIHLPFITMYYFIYPLIVFGLIWTVLLVYQLLKWKKVRIVFIGNITLLVLVYGPLAIMAMVTYVGSIQDANSASTITLEPSFQVMQMPVTDSLWGSYVRNDSILFVVNKPEERIQPDEIKKEVICNTWNRMDKDSIYAELYTTTKGLNRVDIVESSINCTSYPQNNYEEKYLIKKRYNKYYTVKITDMSIESRGENNVFVEYDVSLDYYRSDEYVLAHRATTGSTHFQLSPQNHVCFMFKDPDEYSLFVACIGKEYQQVYAVRNLNDSKQFEEPCDRECFDTFEDFQISNSSIVIYNRNSAVVLDISTAEHLKK